MQNAGADILDNQGAEKTVAQLTVGGASLWEGGQHYSLLCLRLLGKDIMRYHSGHLDS